MKNLALSLLLCFSVGWVTAGPSSLLQAQTVTSVNTPLNLGSVNVCANSAPYPAAGCSTTGSAQFNVTAGGILGPPRVLTLGLSDQDFQLDATTCSGVVATGSSCTVTVTFAPQFAGVRSGAVQIIDESGSLLATRYVQGTGLGPQIDVDNGLLTRVFRDQFAGDPTGLAVDAAGNVFYGAVNPYSVVEIPAAGGAPVTVTTVAGPITGLALDGAGNFYITERPPDQVVEAPAGCGDPSCQIVLAEGFFNPNGVAVDTAGNVYVVATGNDRVLEIPRGCVSSSCLVTIAQGLNDATVLALDNAGNIFISGFGGGVDKVNIASGQKTNIVPDGTLVVTGLALDPAGDLYMSNHGNLQTGELTERILEAPAGGAPMITLAQGVTQPFSLALAGSGNLFVLTYGNGTEVFELNRVHVPAYTFATTPVGTTSSDSPQAFQVQNTGNANLSLLQLTLDPLNNFVQVAGPGPSPNCQTGFILTPGASCNLGTSFTPMSPGLVTATETLLNNSGNTTSTEKIPVAGIGGAPGASISFPFEFSCSAAVNNVCIDSPLTLNGDATIGPYTLLLTDGGSYEAGSSFAPAPIGVASFQTSFDFQVTGSGTSTPIGDGFAFVLQNEGPNALGTPGGGLGYGLPSLTEGGTRITPSVAVKFDLYDNDGEGSNSTGFYVNGAAPTVPAIDLLPSGIDLHSGHVFHVVLVYDGSALHLSITDPMTRAAFSTQFPANLPGLLGGPTAYVGFTGGTGLYTAVQSILDWQLTSSVGP